jgi:hypothetical protein
MPRLNHTGASLRLCPRHHLVAGRLPAEPAPEPRTCPRSAVGAAVAVARAVVRADGARVGRFGKMPDAIRMKLNRAKTRLAQFYHEMEEEVGIEYDPVGVGGLRPMRRWPMAAASWRVAARPAFAMASHATASYNLRKGLLARGA